MRASDAADIRRRTGGDMRLLLRIGALLENRLCFTELALERLTGDEAGRKLIADRSLGTADAAAFAAAAATHGIDDCILLDEAHGAEPGWRVVALADEGGSNPLAGAADAPAVDHGGLPALVGSLAPALRDPVEGLMQARDHDQRAAALERLRYAAPPLTVVGELMPMLLADGAELVRERAVALVVAAGGHTLVVDLVRAMQRRDDATLRRLAPAISGLPADQRELAVSAAVAQAGRGETTQGLIDVCTELATSLAGHRQLDRLIELLLPTAFSLIELVRSLQALAAERMRTILRRGLGFGPAQDARVLVLLAAPGESGDDALLERGIDLLLEPGDEPRGRMPLAAALLRLDPGGGLAGRIARRGMRLCQSQDTSVHWLLAELCRDGAVPAAAASELGATLRRLLMEAPGPHLVGALEQQLPVLLPCSASERAALAEPLVEVIARYRAERVTDLVTNALIGIGEAAAPPVWDAIEHHPLDHVRLLLTGLVPELLARSAEPVRRDGVGRLLAGLQRAEQGAERGTLVAAAARLASLPPLDADPALAEAIDRACIGLGRWGYEALGHLAASAGCDAGRRATIVDNLLAEACAELPDTPSPTSTDQATGEITFELDERLAAHTEHVPQILQALTRIGRSPHCQSEVLRRLVERLVGQWRQVANWRMIWGPGNIHALAHTLAGLAESAAFPGPLRVRVVEALTPQIGQLAVARGLARALLVGEGPYLARLAGRAASELVRLAAAGGEFAEDEQEELVEALTDFLAVPALGPDANDIRQRLVSVLTSLRDHAGSRVRARLRYLCGELPADLAAKLDWV